MTRDELLLTALLGGDASTVVLAQAAGRSERAARYYVIEGRAFLQINDWFDLQGKWGQRRTYPSRYPAPPGWTGDWVNAAGSADEVRAPDVQDAREVRPPLPLPSASSSSLAAPLTGLGSRPVHASQMQRVGQLLETKGRPRMTEEEALALGAALADEAQNTAKVR